MHSVGKFYAKAGLTECFGKICSAAQICVHRTTVTLCAGLLKLVFVLLQASMAVRIPLTALMHLHSLSA